MADVSTSPWPGCRSRPASASTSLDRQERVVRHEQHPVAGGAQPGDGVGRRRGWRVAASQITPSRSQMTDGRRVQGGSRGWMLPSGWHPGLRAPLRTVPRSSATTRPRSTSTQVVAPPYDVLSRGGRASLRRPSRPQHRPRRRAPRVRRSRSLRARPRPRSRTGWPTACSWPTASRPSTLYRMTFTDEAGRRRGRPSGCSARWRSSTTGVDGDGGVLPHEQTTPKASTDRLDLTRATRGQPLPDLGAVARRRADRAAARAR